MEGTLLIGVDVESIDYTDLKELSDMAKLNGNIWIMNEIHFCPMEKAELRWILRMKTHG